MKDEKTLPKWAQERLEALRNDIHERDATIAQLKEAHVLLFESRTWFTIPGPPTDLKKNYHLWYLDKDSPLPACSLGPNDKLLVGRFEDP